MNTLIDDRQRFSSAEACALANITYRQLDYWCRIGTMYAEVQAHGSGSRRRFRRQEVAVLAVLALAGRHVRIGELGELATLLDGWDVDTWDRTLLIDSAGMVWADEAGAPTVSIAINLAAVRAELQARAAA